MIEARYARTTRSVDRARKTRLAVAHIRSETSWPVPFTYSLCIRPLAGIDIDPAAPGVRVCRECAAKARIAGMT